MLPWKTYRSLYFHTLSDACVSDSRLTNGKNKNIFAFVRAGIELGISAFVVLFYLSRRRQALKDGSSKAASFMVLPSYAAILYWIVCLVKIPIPFHAEFRMCVCCFNTLECLLFVINFTASNSHRDCVSSSISVRGTT